MKISMKTCLFLSLVLAPTAFANSSATDSSEKVNRGLENVKDGTKEAAEGISNAASEVGDKASSVGKKVGRSIKAATCPVVGDRKTKQYYAKDSRSYESILDGQKYFEDDDRACFMTEQAARDEGYTRNAN